MYYWLSIQSIVLDEIVSLDGPGGHNLDLCRSCDNPQPQPHTLYRCIECSYSMLHCSQCIVARHKTLPLHRLEVCEPFRHTSITELTLSSIGRTGFSTEPPFIRSDSPATLGTTVTCVLGGPYPAISRSLILMACTKFGFCSVPVIQIPHGMNVTGSCSGCAGTRLPLVVLERLFPSTSSKLIINLPFKVRSTYTTSILQLCRNQTIKDGQSQQ